MPKIPNYIKPFIFFWALFFGLVFLTNSTGLGTIIKKATIHILEEPLKSLNPENKIMLEEFPELDRDFRITIINKQRLNDALTKSQQGGQASVGIESDFIDGNTRILFFIPFFIMLSIIFAYPSPWKRKLISIIIGLFVFYLFLVIRLQGCINYIVETSNFLVPRNINPVLLKLYELIFKAPELEFNVIIGVFIGFILMVRNGDLTNFRKHGNLKNKVTLSK